MRYEDRTFEDETITLDGAEFDRCTFRSCTLHYNGGSFRWSDPSFRDNTRILFAEGVDAFANPVSRWLVDRFMDGGVTVLSNDENARDG